mmetsp:Transcript_11900/g.32506  ORF Transcript_11900/g.32506 Transcript_11900/m.32506 type:complete len:86 (-) Transcript_11900:208-465(-)
MIAHVTFYFHTWLDAHSLGGAHILRRGSRGPMPYALQAQREQREIRTLAVQLHARDANGATSKILGEGGRWKHKAGRASLTSSSG